MFEDVPATDPHFLTKGEGAVVGNLDGERVLVDNLGAMGPDDHCAAGAQASTDNVQPATAEGADPARRKVWLGHEQRRSPGVTIGTARLGAEPRQRGPANAIVAGVPAELSADRLDACALTSALEVMLECTDAYTAWRLPDGGVTPNPLAIAIGRGAPRSRVSTPRYGLTPRVGDGG